MRERDEGVVIVRGRGERGCGYIEGRGEYGFILRERGERGWLYSMGEE